MALPLKKDNKNRFLPLLLSIADDTTCRLTTENSNTQVSRPEEVRLLHPGCALHGAEGWPDKSPGHRQAVYMPVRFKTLCLLGLKF